MDNSIKMIVTDLDGTLLRSDKTISERNLSALRHCREAGVKVIYATGRGGSEKGIVPEGLFDGRIINNGALAAAGEDVVYSRIIPEENIHRLLFACEDGGISAGVSRQGGEAGKFWTEDCTIEDLKFIKTFLDDDLYLVVTNDRIGMIMHRDATKAKAVAALAAVWGIEQNEIAAFGDDLNDIDLLSWAGAGVAMANALPEVKAAAGYICGSNDGDGIAKWIEEYVLI